MGKGDKQETRGQHECLDADGAERGGSGFVGKMDSSLDRAMEREQDVSPAFQSEIRGQWGVHSSSPEHVEETGSH